MNILKKLLNDTSIYYEFFRYVIVGGISFVVDYISLYIFYEYVFKDISIGIYISTCIAFLMCLVINYILSLIFVFISKENRNNVKVFVIFAIIGIIGLILTELGMYIGVDLLKVNYMIIKAVVAIIVLFWNYIGRRMIIFGRKR